MAECVEIAGETIRRGERRRIQIPLALRPTQAEVSMSAEVICGARDGPQLFVCAGIHGDEINGVEIIRRVLRRSFRGLRGTLLAVPIVNVHGFVAHSRTLPDRRDLNRAFPGSPRGSLAARLAHQFMENVVKASTHGIDLHTAAIHRENLPQIRACLDDSETEELARAFGTPVLLNSDLRDGSLREAGQEHGVPVLVYEGGEALRYNEAAIRAGVRGVLRVMRQLRMLPDAGDRGRIIEPFVARSSAWVRAPESGLLRVRAKLGARVKKGFVLGVISDPLGTEDTTVSASRAGIVVGRTRLPVVNEGDALFHVASFDAVQSVAREVESFHDELFDSGVSPPMAD